MKINRINIKKYRQFEDFDLDLTYPEGHEKAGKPLEKVCFIGQSGTGKTTLLELIYGIDFKFGLGVEEPSLSFDNKSVLQERGNIDLHITILNEDYVLSLPLTKKVKEGFPSANLYNNQANSWEVNPEWAPNRYKLILYFAHSSAILEWYLKKAEIDSNRYNGRFKNYKLFDGTTIDSNTRKGIIESSVSNDLWKLFTGELEAFISEINGLNSQANKLLIEGKIEEAKSKALDAKHRELEGNYLLNSFSKLEKLLGHMNLEVFKNPMHKKDTQFLKLKSKEGTIIDQNIWSSGIRQLIQKTIPLHIIKPLESIILVDEPENSFYPDIQSKIVDLYTSYGRNCQFFFATHSPIIASSFEPWEIVELKFNKNGSVFRELYFEGDNHIENYNIFPHRLRYGDIYKEVFDLEIDYNEQRIHDLKEADRIRAEALKLKAEGNMLEAKNEYKKFQKLADTLNWELHEED